MPGHSIDLRTLRPAPRHMRPAVIGFALLVTGSALAYSGGNNVDPQALHFHLVRNFLCDLFMPLNTYNGRPNITSATLGIAGGLLLVVGGLLPAWTGVAQRLAPSTAAAQTVSACGILALSAVVLVPLEKVLVLPWPHHLTLLGAAVPGWCASSGVALLTLRHRGISTAGRVLGLAVLAVVPVMFAAYLPHAMAGEQTPAALALGQKLTLLIVLGWLWALGGSPALRD